MYAWPIVILNQLCHVTSTSLSDRAVVERSRDTNHLGCLYHGNYRRATKPAGEGRGLGLDICRKIIEKHQGRIAVDSQPGKTTFSVWLPIA